MKTYNGSCHCGNVTWDVEADITEVLDCNCSHCSRKGFLLTFVPESQFHLKSGAEHLAEYQFHKKHINHLFCNTCGVESFARGADGEGNVMIAINVRCIPEIEPTSLTVNKYDGASA